MKLLPLALGLWLAALPLASAAPYTDHYGSWRFTGPGPLAIAEGPPLESVLLRLGDGSGFTAFILGLPRSLAPTLGYQLYRPPLLAFECYSDFGTGNLVVRGQRTSIAGACTLSVEDVGGSAKYVVRFAGYQAPLQGYGVYSPCAAPQTC